MAVDARNLLGRVRGWGVQIGDVGKKLLRPKRRSSSPSSASPARTAVPSKTGAGEAKDAGLHGPVVGAFPGAGALLEAADKGDASGVKAAIAAGVNVNARDEYGLTPLILAARRGSAECVRALIAAGADLDARCVRGLTAVIYAAYHESADCARELVAAGANVQVRSNVGMTALATADFLRRHRVVALLSGTTERSAWEHYNPREAAYEKMSQQLMGEHGPLAYVDCISLFPDFEIDLHYQDGVCIRSGPRTGQYDIHFLRLGYTGEGPRYARHFLAAAGFSLTVEEIDRIRAGDSIVLENGKAAVIKGGPALLPKPPLQAISEEDPPPIRQVAKPDVPGASVTMPQSLELSAPMMALRKAALKQDRQKVLALLRENPDLLHTRDDDGRTVLHEAARKWQGMLAGWLVANGAEVNARDSGGNTPLHYAAETGLKMMAILLLTHQADVGARNLLGATPLEVAERHGHADVAELLRQRAGTGS